MADRVDASTVPAGSVAPANGILQLHAQDNLDQNMVGWLF
jgi:hypothetical protein